MNNEQGMMNNEVKTTSYFEISCSKFDILNSYLMPNGSSLRAIPDLSGKAQHLFIVV
jgi:hypothetical protein